MILNGRGLRKAGLFSTIGCLAAASFLFFPSNVAAAPREAPVGEHAALLSYSITVTGKEGGREVYHKLAVTLPLHTRGSTGLDVLGKGLTQAQETELAERSQALEGAFDEGAILAASDALSRMIETCAASEGSAPCRAAQQRYRLAEEKVDEMLAAAGDADAQVVRRDDDDHRFLVFTTEKSPDCGSVSAEAKTGGKSISARYPDPAVAHSDLLACSTQAVLDRREGRVSILMSPATLTIGREVVVDLRPLTDVPDLRLGGFHLSATLQDQPARREGAAFTGERTVTSAGLRYRFQWSLVPQE